MNRSNTSPRAFSIDQLQAALGDAGGPARPEYLPDIVAQVRHVRQRPAWTFLGRWLGRDVAVRRQGVPRAAVLFAVLSLLVAILVAGVVSIGSQRTQTERPLGLPTTPSAWSRVVIDAGTAGRVDSLAAGPRGLLAAMGEGDESRVYFSTDGRDWTRVPADQHPPIGTNGAALVATDQGFLIVGTEVLASDDGLSWRRIASPAEDPDLRVGTRIAAAAGGPGFVAVGSDNKAWYSTNGTDWTLADVPPPPGEPSKLERPLDRTQTQGAVEMQGIAVSGRNLIAWGTSIWVHDDNSATFVPVLWASIDGVSWAKANSPQWAYPKVAGGPNGFAVASEDGAVWLSADGRSWERVADDAFGSSRWPGLQNDDGIRVEMALGSIAAGAAGYIAVGTDGVCLLDCSSRETVIWTSPDGRSWSRLPNDDLFRAPTGAGASVTVARESDFIVGGEYDGKPAIWISGSGQWPQDSAEAPSPDLALSGQMWPQTSLEEVRAAQELADAGDPDYTWQVGPMLASYGDANVAGDPLGAEIFERFIREELGWEEFSGFAIMGYVEMGGHLEGVLFIRCAPGRTNPLYPRAYPEMPPEVRRCVPTIDDARYETVRFNVEQPARRGPSGVWVVTGWEMLQPAQPGSTFEHLYPDFDQRQVEQTAPPSDAEVTALLDAFLGARVEGEGAEKYLHRHGDEGWGDEEVPLLYATTGGTPYGRSEIERVQGPVWPTGWIELKVRLFAGDGTVVEQSFVVVRQESGRLGLVYGSPTSPIPTTENGQAVPVPYSLLDGEVTFAAAPPWGGTTVNTTFTVLGGVGRGSASQFTMFAVVADPLTGAGCEAGPAPADAEALVRSLRSNPDLEVTAPAAVSVGEIDALRMDVVARVQPDVCAPIVLEQRSAGQSPGRLWAGQTPMRLYVLDLPDGMSARILAIAISARDSEFELVVEAAAPIMDSFKFHTR